VGDVQRVDDGFSLATCSSCGAVNRFRSEVLAKATRCGRCKGRFDWSVPADVERPQPFRREPHRAAPSKRDLAHMDVRDIRWKDIHDVATGGKSIWEAATVLVVQSATFCVFALFALALVGLASQIVTSLIKEARPYYAKAAAAAKSTYTKWSEEQERPTVVYVLLRT
jgi:hypothetical protein